MKVQRWIIHRRENPTTDFFIKPLMKGLESQCCFFDLSSLPDCLPEQSVDLIIVRYLTSNWIKWINQNRERIRTLIFFMDDDLFDLKMHIGLPLKYRFKLYKHAYRHQEWLKRQNTVLWVSTRCLQDKYSDWQPRLISPGNPHSEYVLQKTVFYHGSTSHVDEFKWLRPVIEEVLEKDPTLTFEVIGDKYVRRLFSDLSRVNVLYPMGWDAYQALIARPGRTIGLAPLSDASFNLARSPTKFYDIKAAGAVGIYADHPVYRTFVSHDENGLLIPMEQKLWVEAILRLSRSPDLRERLICGMES